MTTQDDQAKYPSGTYTWTRKNLFNPKTVKKSETITRWERLRLLLRAPRYSFDWDGDIATLTRYKVMNGKCFIMSVKRMEP